jgi:cathepsin B
MQKLRTGLQAKIAEKPTNTILPDDQVLAFNVMKNIYKNPPFDIPETFDGITNWKDLLCPVMDQGSCGSCWAFATTSMLANRFNIQSLGKMNIQLSPTKLILCDWQGKEINQFLSNDNLSQINEANENLLSLQTSACFGNTLADAARYLYEIGTTTEQCIPYNKKLGSSGQEYQTIGSFTEIANLPLCSTVAGPWGDECNNFVDDGTQKYTDDAARFYKCISYYGLYGSNKDNPDGNEKQIQYEIYKWGPIVTGIKLYPDFYTFDPVTTIYEWNGDGPQVGGHAIEILGWGEENGIPYWQVKNSWGDKWGINGYFKMVRGKNNCGIETHCMAMLPDFFYPINYPKIPKMSLTIIDQAQFDNITNVRNKIALQLRIPAGGIDPTTGYSRRIMNRKPYINFLRPIELNNLPNWNDFIAGKNTQNSDNPTHLRSITTQNKNTSSAKIITQFIILIICLPFFLIILFTLYK